MIQIIAALLLASSAYASPETDAIKAQAGCYNVDFKFEETQKMDPNYPISSKPYHEWGTEYVEVDFESEDEIHLQHVLITPHGPLKHWRQEWKRNPSKVLAFKGDNTWESNAVAKPTEELWLQRVYQVDDSPRYECAAPWKISEQDAVWSCKTWSPLPRREFSQRSDYNILDRGNFVGVDSKGWTHFQYNDKIIYKDNQCTMIAKEKGANTYTKIDSATCESAQKWWKENKAVWHDIQTVWREIYETKSNIKLKAKVDDKVLWMHLFELADSYGKETSYDSKALQKDAYAIIQKFMEN